MKCQLSSLFVRQQGVRTCFLFFSFFPCFFLLHVSQTCGEWQKLSSFAKFRQSYAITRRRNTHFNIVYLPCCRNPLPNKLCSKIKTPRKRKGKRKHHSLSSGHGYSVKLMQLSVSLPIPWVNRVQDIVVCVPRGWNRCRGQMVDDAYKVPWGNCSFLDPQ